MNRRSVIKNLMAGAAVVPLVGLPKPPHPKFSLDIKAVPKGMTIEEIYEIYRKTGIFLIQTPEPVRNVHTNEPIPNDREPLQVLSEGKVRSFNVDTGKFKIYNN